MSAMGMMHEGYFVGRKELINWIRQYFDPGFSKVEDLASGVVYCQIIDSVYPGTVPMRKVKMGAKTEVDFIHNFKILQTSFGKKKIDRYIDVDKLCKRSFQYNMEFLQFMKCYWDMHAPDGCAPDAVFQEQAVTNEPARQPQTVPTARKQTAGGAKAPPVPGPLGGTKRSSNAPAPPPAPSAASTARRPSEAAQPVESRAAQDEAANLEITELKLSVDNLERERDFYYMKLREVEMLCQEREGESIPFLQEVLDILYKTDDAEEFVNPEEVAAVQ